MRSPPLPARPGGPAGIPEAPSAVGRVGRLAGPVAAVAVHVSLGAGTAAEARATAAVAALMAVWWMTEALPLGITALVPIVLLPTLGALPLAEVVGSYAHELLLLFLGGFCLARAVESCGLHRRLALHVVRLVGTDARRLTGGFALAAAALSMWVSNTATTVMMLPVVVSVLRLLAVEGRPPRRLAVGMLLATAYGASIGSLATLIGTPPNALLAAWFDRQGTTLGFARWFAFGLPVSLVLLFLMWWLVTRWLSPPEVAELPGGREVIRRELAALGPVGFAERLVAAVFAATVALWLLRAPLETWWPGSPTAALGDAGIAIAAAIVLSLLRVQGRGLLTAADLPRLPWEVLLLFGGGLALAHAIGATGLDLVIGDALVGLTSAPSVVLVGGIALLVVTLTELTSNTATAATLIPLLGGTAASAGIAPALLVVPTALAATCAFALPVATPPNAIVYGSGLVTVREMLRVGVVLNLVATVVITLATLTLAGPILGF